MVSWMFLGLCIHNIGCSWNVTFVKHLQVIKLTLYLDKIHKVDDQDMMVGELFNASDLDCQ